MYNHSSLPLSLALAFALAHCGSPAGGGVGGAVLPDGMRRAPNAPTEDERAAAWNLRYAAPSGWRAQDLGAITVYGSPDTSRAVFVGRAMFSTWDEALATTAALAQSVGLQTTGVAEAPAESTVAGLRATSASYVGYNASGLPSQGRLVVLFTPHGTSLSFFGLSAPEASAEVAEVIARMAASVRAGAPQLDHAAARALAGRWGYSDGSFNRSSTSTSNRGVEATLLMDGGAFQFTSNSWVSVDVRRTTAGESPVDLGSSESSRSMNDAGRYAVIGREVVFAGSRGQLVVPYSLGGGALTLGATTYARR